MQDAFAILVLVVLAVLLALLSRTVRVVPQAQVYVIERLGRFSRIMQPGLHILTPVVDRVRTKLDMREQVVAFAPQAVITKDNLVVGVDSVLYFQITDASLATYAIEDYVAAIEQLVVTTLRNVIGGMDLEAALTGRDHINGALAMVLDEATGKWGIKVNRVEIRAIEPPATIRDAMEQAMRADRSKRAAITTAEGQQQSQVLTAEGIKQATVLQAEADKASRVLAAEADKTAAILAAEADKEAALLRAEGEAAAIARVVEAIKAAQVDEHVLAYQQMQQLPAIANGQATKLFFVPSTLTRPLERLGELLPDRPE